MSLQKFLLGKNEDGSPHYLYVSDDDTKPVVITGSVVGDVTVGDGTTYNVSEPVIEVSAGHDGEISHLIGMRYEAEGHPKHDDEHPFIHSCTEHCGSLAIEGKHPNGPLGAVRVPADEEIAAGAEAAPVKKGGRK